MPYYRIYGTVQYDANVRVEADSPEEALELVKNAREPEFQRGDFLGFDVDESNEPEVEG